MESPHQSHVQVAKRTLHYLKGTQDYGLLYTRAENFSLVEYSDIDWGGDLDDRKSTSGYYFLFGNAVCSWSSKKQPLLHRQPVKQSTLLQLLVFVKLFGSSI